MPTSRAIRAATRTTALELHCHNTTGLAPLIYSEGLKAGFTILHRLDRVQTRARYQPVRAGGGELSVGGIQYALGDCGPLAKALQPSEADRILSTPRAREFLGWVRPQPTLAEIRSKMRRGLSDVDLLLRFMTSNEEVDAIYAAGPMRTDPRRVSLAIAQNLSSLLSERGRSTTLAVTS